MVNFEQYDLRRHREARSDVARHCEDREPKAWRDVAIQGRAAGVCHAALDRHASLAMTE